LLIVIEAFLYGSVCGSVAQRRAAPPSRRHDSKSDTAHWRRACAADPQVMPQIGAQEARPRMQVGANGSPPAPA